MKKTKKLLSMFLAVCMLATMLVITTQPTAFAESVSGDMCYVQVNYNVTVDKATSSTANNFIVFQKYSDRFGWDQTTAVCNGVTVSWDTWNGTYSESGNARTGDVYWDVSSWALGTYTIDAYATVHSKYGDTETIHNTTMSITVTCSHSGCTTTTSTVSATCTSGGYTNYKCTKCNATWTGSNTSALGHSYTSTSTASSHLKSAATCTAAAVYYKSCSRCGANGTQTFSSGSSLGHNYSSSVTTNPGCTTTGVRTYTCSRCNNSYTEDIAATGHTAGAAATCTTAQTCTICGATITPATGHTAEEDAAVPATCTETGLTAGSHCSVCDAVLVAQEVVPATGHTEEADAAVPATCTETGLTAGSHCSVCDAVLVAQEVVPATGHTAGEGAVETVEGVKKLVTRCTVCDAILSTEDIGAAVNKTTGTYYETVAEAVTAASDGDIIALCEDVTIDKSQFVSGKSITLDLNGFSYTSTNANTFIAGTSKKTFTITDSVGTGSVNGNLVQAQNGGSITIEGGTFNALVKCIGSAFGAAGVLTINGGVINGNGETAVAAYRSGKVVINDGKINDDVYVMNKGKLEVNGGTFKAKDYCIEGNGTDTGTEIVINGGKFVANNMGAAIYHPQAGTLTINDGTFYGGDALYLKSGTTVINGGTFKARGAKADYAYYGNGFNQTGDTIVVDSCGYPGGAPALTINGGSFYSDNNEIIGYYVHGDNDLESTGFIVDGSFGKTVPATYYADPTAFTLFNVKGGKATVDGTTVTITADEGSDKIEVSSRATNGSDIVVETVSGGATVSKSGTLYSSEDGTASVTVPNEGTYTVVFDFEEPEVPLVENLRITNATAAVNETTITLTPVNAEKAVSLVCKLLDGTAIAFSNLDGAKVSKNGSLYANSYATATATIDGDEYTVVFDYEVPEVPEVALADNLRVTNATVTVEEDVITLTPVDDSSKISFVPKTLDGKVIEVLSTQTKVSKNGTLYSTNYCEAEVRIDGDTYTVEFDFPEAAPVNVLELLKITGANNVEVDGNDITITASAAQVNIYSTLTNREKATFSDLDGAKVSKSGTLYAKGDATATVTVGGVNYDVTIIF